MCAQREAGGRVWEAWGWGPADVRAECPSAGRGRVGVGKSLGVGDRPRGDAAFSALPCAQDCPGASCVALGCLPGSQVWLRKELIMLPPYWGRVSGWKVPVPPSSLDSQALGT